MENNDYDKDLERKVIIGVISSLIIAGLTAICLIYVK